MSDDDMRAAALTRDFAMLIEARLHVLDDAIEVSAGAFLRCIL